MTQGHTGTAGRAAAAVDLAAVIDLTVSEVLLDTPDEDAESALTLNGVAARRRSDDATDAQREDRERERERADRAHEERTRIQAQERAATERLLFLQWFFLEVAVLAVISDLEHERFLAVASALDAAALRLATTDAGAASTARETAATLRAVQPHLAQAWTQGDPRNLAHRLLDRAHDAAWESAPPSKIAAATIGVALLLAEETRSDPSLTEARLEALRRIIDARTSAVSNALRPVQDAAGLGEAWDAARGLIQLRRQHLRTEQNLMDNAAAAFDLMRPSITALGAGRLHQVPGAAAGTPSPFAL